MAKKSPATIKKENAGNSAVVAIVDDLENYSALSAIADQKGGELLVSGLVSDILTGIDVATTGFKTMSHAELMGVCASLKANMDLLRVLTRAHKNKDLASEALEEALKE